jgi:hypothetical protein
MELLKEDVSTESGSCWIFKSIWKMFFKILFDFMPKNYFKTTISNEKLINNYNKIQIKKLSMENINEEVHKHTKS